MTVSRVINGSARVTEATHKRVFDAIEQLGYRPNQVARSLRNQLSRQIGIIVPHLQDSYFAACAQAVSLVTREHGYSVSIAMSYEDPQTEYHEAMLMLLRHVEGLVVIPAAGSASRLTGPDFKQLPIVALDRPLGKGAFDSVVVENRKGAQVAVQHLIDHGHSSIAFLGMHPELYTLRMRERGYREAMRRAGLQSHVWYGSTVPAEMIALIDTQLRKRGAPTALFCGTGLTTRMALQALSALAVSIPKTVAVVGFDDFETADLLQPAVTVIRQPTTDMGRVGADMLFARLGAESSSSPAKQVVLPVELVLRRSCGTHP